MNSTQGVAGGSTQLVDGILPEVGRHTVGHITAETVDAHVDNPELHGVDHCLAHVLVVVVQVAHTAPALTGIIVLAEAIAIVRGPFLRIKKPIGCSPTGSKCVSCTMQTFAS